MVGWAARTQHRGLSGWAGKHGELHVPEGYVRMVVCVLCHRTGGELRRAFKSPEGVMKYVHPECFKRRAKEVMRDEVKEA